VVPEWSTPKTKTGDEEEGSGNGPRSFGEMRVEQRRPDPSPYAPPPDQPANGGPTVSVCVPVFNAEGFIRRAIESALGQTYPDLEVVVVDNASADATLRRVLEIDDPRVRLFANARNLGVSRNFNRALGLARGRYIQFLCADDVLYPDCVEAMLRVFESDPRVGLVFSPRDIELEDPSDPSAARWKAKHERAHTRFGDLREVNSGEALLETWIGDQFASNWIGEPTNVMMSRECLNRIGTFPIHLHDRGDMDLWARAMLFYSVGFVDRPLVRYLVRSGSLAAWNRETGQAWLDMLWFLEGMLTFDEIRQRYPAILRLRRRTIIRNVRNLLRRTRTPATGKLRGVGRYVGFRLRGRHDRSKLFGTLDDRGDAGETVAVERGVTSGSWLS
jgi:glycosyltransferase involved in cell wall biosynthesis